MTTLREELEKLADEPWPHGGPRYGRTELAIAAANLALEAVDRACCGMTDEAGDTRAIGYNHGVDDCIDAIRAILAANRALPVDPQAILARAFYVELRGVLRNRTILVGQENCR